MSSSAHGKARSGPYLRSQARSHVSESMALRAQADEIIKGWWIYLPLIAVASGLVALLAFVFLVPGTGGLVLGYVVMYALGFALLAILNYKLTRRLAEHFRREALLRDGMVEDIMSRSAEGGTSQDSDDLARMGALDLEAVAEERTPSLLFAPMSALPLVGFAFEYHYLRALTRLPARHEVRWLSFVGHHSSAGGKLGQPSPATPASMVGSRSFAIYALLSLLFFPLLGYWYHLLIKEMNGHFQAQWAFEDALLAGMA